MEGIFTGDLMVHLHWLQSNDGLQQGTYKVRVSCFDEIGYMIAYCIPECPKKMPFLGKGAVENDRVFVSREFSLKRDSVEINN